MISLITAFLNQHTLKYHKKSFMFSMGNGVYDVSCFHSSRILNSAFLLIRRIINSFQSILLYKLSCLFI